VLLNIWDVRPSLTNLLRYLWHCTFLLFLWWCSDNVKQLKNYLEATDNTDQKVLNLKDHIKGGYSVGYLWHICSLSLWRLARGSKLMRLELIHGLFIT
jgi:hypothetical protein